MSHTSQPAHKGPTNRGQALVADATAKIKALREQSALVDIAPGYRDAFERTGLGSLLVNIARELAGDAGAQAVFDALVHEPASRAAG